MLSGNTLDKLEGVLLEIVNETGTWKEKKEQIETELSEEGKTALIEFVVWFEDEVNDDPA